ncbi:MAG: formate dehydrogenase accessory protein FdhE [Chloroflexi bacterium]|nr:formate dehydrogenase accessory protein FdhE [Chloroflexota bacterium]
MTQTAPTDSRITAITNRLDTLAERMPELAEPIAFYRAALPLLRQAQATVEPFSLPTKMARHKLAAGIPLLLGEDLPLDPDATRDLFIGLCRVVEEVGLPGPTSRKRGGWSFAFGSKKPDPMQLLEQVHNGNEAALRAAAAAQIRQAVEQKQLDLLLVWSALAAGDLRSVELAARDHHLEAELLRMLAQNSLKPALRVWAQGLKIQVALDTWRRGQCPFCGSPPALSEIQGKEGARHLRCAMCGGDWPYLRLKCAHCGNNDYKSLGYITVEGEQEKYSIQTCEACRNYSKVIVTFEPTLVDLLPVEDLATLHLDLIAAERGYSY